MMIKVRWLVSLALVGLVGLRAAPAEAQETEGYTQVVSANPFGLLLDLFNAEYERAFTESTTIGLGGSFGKGNSVNDLGTLEESTYFNADVFMRFYASGNHFEGWNFGAKLGVTSIADGTFPGYGFDVNRSWLVGANDNFYVGAGIGLKRLIGDFEEDETRLIPTLRIINVGFAF